MQPQFSRQRITTEPSSYLLYKQDLPSLKSVQIPSHKFHHQNDAFENRLKDTKDLFFLDKKQNKGVRLNRHKKFPSRFNFKDKFGEDEAEVSSCDAFLKAVQSKSEQYKKKSSLLNSLIEILKPSSQQHQINQKSHSLQLQQFHGSIKTKNIKNPKIILKNQFAEILSQNSTKNYRGPKILENQMTKLSSFGNIVRRRIMSEEKSRKKSSNVEKQGKEEVYEKEISFDGVEILTFSNKFPGLDKKGKQKPCVQKLQTENQFEDFQLK